MDQSVPINQGEFDSFMSKIRSCRQCRDLFGFEPNPIVFGSPISRIMQISQAPSKTVYETGKPFNDASGRRLRQEWYQITDDQFYNPVNFYIVSIAHCYPGKAPKGGDRRPPTDCAKRWLRKEMKLVDNQIYILIGKIAADFFFPGRNFTDLVFEDQIIQDKPAYILPHPSPVNVKWFLDHPEFLDYRIIEVSRIVRQTLKN